MHVMNSLRIMTLLLPILICTLVCWPMGSRIRNPTPMIAIIAIGHIALLFQLSNRFQLEKLFVLLFFVLSISAATVMGEFYGAPNAFQVGWYEGDRVPESYATNTARLRFLYLILELLLTYVIARLGIWALWKLLGLQNIQTASSNGIRWIPQFSIAAILWCVLLIALGIGMQLQVKETRFDLTMPWRGITETLFILMVSWGLLWCIFRIQPKRRHLILALIWIGVPLVTMTVPFDFSGGRRPTSPYVLKQTTWTVYGFAELLVLCALASQCFLLWVRFARLSDQLVDRNVMHPGSKHVDSEIECHPLD